MPRPTEDQLTQVRELFVGQRVRIYGGKQITVERIETIETAMGNCFQFFAKGDSLGYLATLSQITLTRAKGASR